MWLELLLFHVPSFWFLCNRISVNVLFRKFLNHSILATTKISSENVSTKTAIITTTTTSTTTTTTTYPLNSMRSFSSPTSYSTAEGNSFSNLYGYANDGTYNYLLDNTLNTVFKLDNSRVYVSKSTLPFSSLYYLAYVSGNWFITGNNGI